MKKEVTKGKSVKKIRLDSEIERQLTSIIYGLADPRISTTTQVSDVYVSGDLSYCRIYITVDKKEEQDTLIGLEKASGYIKKELAEAVRLRKVPDMKFVVDETERYANHIEEILNELKTKDAKAFETKNDEVEEKKDLATDKLEKIENEDLDKDKDNDNDNDKK